MRYPVQLRPTENGCSTRMPMPPHLGARGEGYGSEDKTCWVKELGIEMDEGLL